MNPDKITRLCKLKGVTLRAACQAAGLKYSTLHAQISNNRPVPFTTVDKLARALNVPLSYFSDQQPVFQFAPDSSGTAPSQVMLTMERSINEQTKLLAQQGLNISIDDVLDWLVQERFVLRNAEWLKDRIDLFFRRKPEEIMAQPQHIGEKSLSAQFLGLHTDMDYAEHMARLDKTLIDKINSAHDEMTPQMYSVTDQAIDVMMNGARIRGSYRRLLAGVTDENGNAFTLVFCRLIRFSNG